MIRIALVVLILLAGPLTAQSLPALYDVTGVASDDALNIRAEPNASASILDGFGHNQTGIEVVGIDPTGQWGRVNTGERSGWVSLRYLRLDPDHVWSNMERPLRCYGTEPFWNVNLTPRVPSELFYLPDESTPMIPQWESSAFGSPSRMILRHAIPDGEIISYLEAESCNDGMSDREFGLSLRMFVTGSNSTLPDGILQGCCSITGF